MKVPKSFRQLKPVNLLLSLLVVMILWGMSIYTPIIRIDINELGIRLDHFAEIPLTIYMLVFLSLALTEIHYRRIKGKKKIPVWDEWGFVAFFVTLSVLFTWAMGVHWSMNLVNVLAEEAGISLEHLGPMVYFFDEKFGHFLPYLMIGTIYSRLLWFDALKPLDKKKVDVFKISVLSIPFGVVMGVGLIESSFGGLLLNLLMLLITAFTIMFISKKITISWLRQRPYTLFTVFVVFLAAVTMFIWHQQFGLDIQPSYLWSTA